MKEIEYDYWKQYFSNMSRCVICGKFISNKVSIMPNRPKSNLTVLRVDEIFWDDNIDQITSEDYEAPCHIKCKNKLRKIDQ